MTARLIDGTAISAQVREEVREAAQEILNATGQRPGLAVILVGDSAASQVYVRNKIRACEAAGFHSVSEHLPEETTEAALLARLDELNKDPAVHGILVQLPLPAHIDTRRVIEAISPDKDVDGFHVANAGALMTGAPQLVPCTPLGVMRLLESTGVPLRGAEAVIVGASNLVGKPQLHLLLQAGATVTLCNSKTRDLAAQTAPAAAQPILNIGQIHDKLQAAGYTDIREIELEKRGFYEVKARDAQGQPVKLHVSAANGEVARSRAR